MTHSPFKTLLSGLTALLLWTQPVAAQTETMPPAYVGSEACSDCHQDAARAWTGSHHDLAWTEPGPDTVIADFDGTEFAHDGTLTRFRIEDGRYFATVTEKDGTTTDYPLHSVAGIAPLQQYLYETEPGRLQSSDVVWDAEQREWYHLYPDQDLPPDDGLHWTGPYKTWNARCAECHATGYQRNFSPRTGRYSSSHAEIGVGCEACHGPGSAHLDLVAGKALASDAGLDRFGFSAPLGQGDTVADIQQCAGCHSRRETLDDGNPQPGRPYAEDYTLSLLRPGLYHADGQILDEVYVYGSFLQSKMYAKGVGCMDCHDPHSAGLKAEGNALCSQCHSPAGNPDYASLPLADFDSPAHHFHPEGSPGAQCKSCHMDEVTYMGIDGRRDHSFRIPRPDLAAETGAPDACTSCHTDQAPDWAAAQIASWYPESDNRGPHYGQALALGQRDLPAAIGSLTDLATDANQPGIVRATALFLLQPAATEGLAAQTATLLADPDPLVRTSAAALQRGATSPDRMTRLMPLLLDPVRSVRVGTVKHLLDTPPDQLTRSQRAVLGEAMLEWRNSLSNKLDFPETHLVMGGIALSSRNFEAAASAFAEVVRLDPQRVEAWTMLVRLTAALQGPAEARQTLRAALDRVPDDPGLRQLGVELGR